MTNAEYIAHFLKARGVDHVYELVGGMITFMVDAIHRCTDINIVSMHHEQGAGFAAEGWARMKGIPGVALATSGPGATNLLTPIGSCYFDSVPAVFITGQVNRHEQKGDKQIRQLGFQETDIVTMAKPVTKAAMIVNDPADLPRMLSKAFRLAVEGRPGPVLLDVPMDVQRHTCVDDVVWPESTSTGQPTRDEFVDFTARVKRGLAVSQRPLILAGGGIRSGGAQKEFAALAEHVGIPVVHSLMGVDVLPSTSTQRIGMIGSYGNRWANKALSRSDLLLVLGSRLDVRQTGSDVVGFRGERVIFHADCEPGELNNRVCGCDTVVGELIDVMNALRSGLTSKEGARAEWMSELTQLKQESPDTGELAGVVGINPNELMHSVSSLTSHAAAYVVDVGQHQMWAAQSLDLAPGQRFLTSGGMGAMGFALPAAIGAAIASGPVVMIAGDGGFQLNIQELQTIVRNRLPVKLLVIDNGCHGMVRQFQESYFHGRYQSTVWGYSAPDFEQVARAYGIYASTVQHSDELDSALRAWVKNPEQPSLLTVKIEQGTNAYPKLAFGRAFGEMEPEAKPLEMEGT
jgi:acetolactate synthase-1/2/3 large subunit